MKRTLFLLTLLTALLLCGGAWAESISGCAYVDANANGLCDPGEQLMTGVPMALEQERNGAWETLAQTVTDEYGLYAFDGVTGGDFRVRCALSGLEWYAASLGENSGYADGFLCLDGVAAGASGLDVGLRPAAGVKVHAFRDSDGNGRIGKYERDLANITVEVVDGDTVLAKAVTNKKGLAEMTLAPGAYRLRFTAPEGMGFTVAGEDSCAADSGTQVTYSEPMTFTAGLIAEAGIGARSVGSFSGQAWEDMNNNGLLDEGEPGVAGVTVNLVGQKTGVSRSIVTDGSGEYHFGNLPDDKYTVTSDLPDGMLYARYSQTGGDLRSIFTGSIVTRDFSVKSDKPIVSKNIGVVQKGAITGHAFFDLNYNGLWDEDEPGYAGVTIEAVKLSSNESMGKCVTGEDGAFRVENLRGGDYRLRAVLPDDGSVFTVTAEGTPDAANRFEHRSNRRENSLQPLTIESGGEASVIIGLARGATVSGTVFQDADYNGHQNGKEKALSGIKVRAVDSLGNVSATATTNQKGQYTLSGIMPGKYTIQVQRKTDFGFTRLRPEEKGGSHIAILEGDWGRTDVMTIAMAQEIKAVNAGMLPSSTVSGSFFHDANDNGLWDETELGMLSAQVRLLSEDGEIDLYQTPAEDGSYFFDGVMPGKYTLSYLLAEHCEMARVTSGGNTVKHGGLTTSVKAFKVTMAEDVTMPLAGAVTLGSFEGLAFRDSNANGLQDAGEASLSGVSVTLSGADGAFDAVTAADGAFSLTGLRPGDYTLSLSLPEGYIFSHSVDSIPLDTTDAQELSCPWQVLINRTDKLVGAVEPASIHGEIWMDENQDGAQGETEWIMEGLTLYLMDEADGSIVASTVSASDGFLFENVRPGSYAVYFPLPDQSSPAQASASTFALESGEMYDRQVSVSEGEAIRGLHTGLVSLTSIGGTAWLDENGSRSAVPGVTITLHANGQALQTTVTDESGTYRFDGLWPASYTLTASIPDGMIFVRPGDPNYAANASVIAASENGQGSSNPFSLLMAQHQLHCDVLFIKPGKVGDIAWLDENKNGLVDGTEHRLPGVTVRLLQNGQTAYETVTDAYGYYLFAHVYPGEYTLEASAYPELSPTTPVDELRIISSCLVTGDGESAQSEAFRVESGETNKNFDLGYILPEGQTLSSEAAAEAPGRDWTLSNTPKD